MMEQCMGFFLPRQASLEEGGGTLLEEGLHRFRRESRLANVMF